MEGRRQSARVLQLGRGKLLLLEWMVTVVVKVHDGGGGGGRVMLMLYGLELRASRHVRRVVDVVSVGGVRASIRGAFNLNTESLGELHITKLDEITNKVERNQTSPARSK